MNSKSTEAFIVAIVSTSIALIISITMISTLQDTLQCPDVKIFPQAKACSDIQNNTPEVFLILSIIFGFGVFQLFIKLIASDNAPKNYENLIDLRSVTHKQHHDLLLRKALKMAKNIPEEFNHGE